MCGGAGAPQKYGNAEVNCIYADIQNSAVIRSIFGEKNKKNGETKTKTRSFDRLTRREGEKMGSGQMEASTFDHKMAAERQAPPSQSRKGQ